MRDPDGWKPTKYVEEPTGHLRASRDPDEVTPGSRVYGDMIAAFYAQAISRYARGSLLDLGCGKAPLVGYYRRYVGDVVLVDWENSQHPNPHIDIIQDLNEPLTRVNSDAFDTVILSDVLEHIREPAGLLGEISRVLVDGGHLLMSIPFLYGIHEAPHDYFRYTSYGITNLCDGAGLDIVELEPMGGALEVFTDMASKALAQLPRGGSTMAGVLQSAGVGLSKRGPLRRISAASARAFTLGYTVVASRRRRAGHPSD
jgi:SAM-dependent methyltransferase